MLFSTRPTRSDSQGKSRTHTRPARGPLPRRPLRVEPLEDRRMLSVLFVDTDAAEGGNGLGWSTAFRDLQDALDRAAEVNGDSIGDNDVDQIWIAEGTYRPIAELEPGDPRSASFSLVDGVTLYGGFLGAETALEERDTEAHETILSGDIGVGYAEENAYTVVYCGSEIEARIDGLTVTEGNADGTATVIGPRIGGGGIYNRGTLEVKNSTITGNRCSGSGAGAFNHLGTLRISESTFASNSTLHGDGGGVFNWEGSVDIAGSVFQGNSATSGGAIGSFATVTVVNSVLVGNTAVANGGGVYTWSTLNVANSTIAGNHADSGGGIFDWGTSQITVYNTVVAANRISANGAATEADLVLGIGSIDARHCYVGVGPESPNPLGSENGNLVGSADQPLDSPFVHNPSDGGDGWKDDPETPEVDESANNYYGDLRLKADSTAVHAGDETLLPEDAFDLDGDGDTAEAIPFDFVGNPRVQESVLDMGAYEGPIAGSDPGSIVFVDCDAPAGGTGTDWAFALRDLQTALGMASAYNADDNPENDVDQIWIAEGTYRPSAELFPGHPRSATFALADSTTLYGGFAGTETALGQRDWVAHETILSGEIGDEDDVSDNAFAVVSCLPETTAQMDGLTVTEGKGDGPGAEIVDGPYGGGISSRGTLTVANARIVKNLAWSAAGVAVRGGSFTLKRSVVAENFAGYRGGGIAIDGGTDLVRIEDSALLANTAFENDGGAICGGGRIEIVGTTISGNRSGGNGGAIAHSSGGNLSKYLSLANCVVSGNFAAKNGGGIKDDYTLSITDSTISGNRSLAAGGGVHINGFNWQIAKIHNAIVVGNDAATGPDLCWKTSSPNVTCSLIGDGSGATGLIDGENGNLVGTAEAPIDPEFVRNPSDGGDGWGDDPDTLNIDESANDDYGDFRLSPDSPAVDAGDAALLPADTFDLDGDGNTEEAIPFDLAGNARVEGDGVDLGAYEYIPPPVISGDLDGDGFVGALDLDIVRANWGQVVTPGSLIDGDPSGDGRVGVADLDILRTNWEQAAPAGMVVASKAAKELADAGKTNSAPAPSRHGTSLGRDRLQALADAAWVRSVKTEEERSGSREARAVDAVLLVWGGNGEAC